MRFLHKKPTAVKAYLKELRRTRKDKPPRVKEALDIYLGLWDQAIGKGLVLPGDEVGDALRRVGTLGGLYQAAGD